MFNFVMLNQLADSHTDIQQFPNTLCDDSIDAQLSTLWAKGILTGNRQFPKDQHRI
jgi:hypothetical protein